MVSVISTDLLVVARVADVLVLVELGEFLISSLVRPTWTVRPATSMDEMTPAGSRTVLPKIHTPVSTTMYAAPTSSECLSTLPIEPSLASTLNPVRSVPV